MDKHRSVALRREKGDTHRVKCGDTVRVHYIGKLIDGTEFENGPIDVTVGSGQVLSGFENALVGMAVGDIKSVTLEPKDAYGAHDSSLVYVVDRACISSEIDLEFGSILQATDSMGRKVRFWVAELDAEKVTLNANHFMAGQTLTYQLELVKFIG